MHNKKITLRNQFILLFTYFCWMTLTCSCQSTEKSNPTLIHFGESEYTDIIENYAALAQEYDGLQNTIEFQTILLNSHVIEAQTLRKADILQWEKSKYNQELNARKEKAKETTEVFVSFFTPERKTSDLTRSETLWKIFLTSKGKRYEGKAEKISQLNAEIQSLYPQHNRWSNPYIVKFTVPIREIEIYESELTITGPIGTKSVWFKALNK